MKRKRNRLEYFSYEGNYSYFLTLSCYDNENYFKDNNIVSGILENLKSTSTKMNFTILAYCFMPNHLHILASGSEKSNLVKYIKIFKQMTGYNFKKSTGKNLWQKSFHDHVVRKEENLNSIAKYIFNNPVRKGLVGDYNDYPFLGPKEFDNDL